MRRSSNSPRYLAPASIEAMSSAMSRLFLSPSGTSPSAMRAARPSTIAVLPTPGSPMSTGLFLVRRDSTWMQRRISSSRPMTGSILPSAARAVRSWPYFSSAANFSSGFWSVTRCDPRTSFKTCSNSSEPTSRRAFIASSRCSTDRKSSRRSLRYESAFSTTLFSSLFIRGSAPPYALGSFCTASSARLRTISGA